MRKVIVIANCHSMSLARALALGGRDLSVEFIDLNFLNREDEVSLIRKMRNGDLGDAEVLSFVASPRFSPVSTPEMRELFGAKLRTFTNIRFDGLHPDMTLVGPMDGRRHGLLGPYHSKIVLYSYHSGLSWVDCLRLFDYRVYESLGYFEEFQRSSAVLLTRDTNCDIKFASKFLELARQVPTLYTVNHPTGAVFQRLSQLLCKTIDAIYVDFGAEFSINDLSNNFLWPVYDELSEYHSLGYRTPQYFAGLQSFESRSYSLEEFVRGSLHVYERNDDGNFRKLIEDEPFFGQFTRSIDTIPS